VRLNKQNGTNAPEQIFMRSNVAAIDLIWDAAILKTYDKTQRWVLPAMHNNGRELVTMLWRILGNEQDVCDAYQDTFLNLAHYQGGEKPKNIKAYLFRAANNAAVSILRKKIARKKLSNNLAQRQPQNPANRDIDSQNLQENLRYFITRLPEHLRNVITLRDFAEMPYVQIGKMLNISADTARVYRCKALQLLAVWMNRE